MEPIRTCQLATHYKYIKGKSPIDPTSDKIYDDLLTPCSPSDKNAIEMTLKDVPGDKLVPPILSVNDFMKSLKSAKSSVSKEDLGDFETFTQEFGVEG